MRAKLVIDVQIFVGIVAATVLVAFVPYFFAFARWPRLNPVWEGLYLAAVPLAAGALTRRVFLARRSHLCALSDALFGLGAILLGLLGDVALTAFVPSPWMGWGSVVLPPLLLALAWALAFSLAVRRVDATWTVRPYLVVLTLVAIAVRAPTLLAPGALDVPVWLPSVACGFLAGGFLVLWRLLPAIRGRVKLTRPELLALLGATASVLGWLLPH